MPAAKKTTKKVVKRVTKKRTVSRKPKNVPLQSFQVAREKVPFMTFKITDQTIYWTALLLMILALGLWVLNIQMNISNILNTVKL